MIKIEFSEPSTAEWKSWREQCDVEQERLNVARRSGKEYPIKEPVYKGTRFRIKRDVFINKDGPFFGKCAYCEETISRNQHGDIEHYRPKSRVCDINNVTVMINVRGNLIEHPGYYWLAYDWRNLLPACILCNQQPSEHDPYGKGNRFPVAGNYAAGEDETGDQPLLLNPTVEDPADHIDINELGIIQWITEAGRTSRDVLGLNQRGLPDARKEKLESARDAVGALLRAVAVDPDGTEVARLLEKLRRIRRGEDEHSMAGRKGITLARNRVEPLWNELNIA